MNISKHKFIKCSKNIFLRLAEDSDSNQMLAWRNEITSRQFSTYNKTITKNEHVEWFKNAVNSSEHQIFVISNKNQGIGIIRFELINSIAVVSIYITESEQGKGIGYKVIEKGSETILKYWGIDKVIAYVKNDNSLAQYMFKKAGYYLIDGPDLFLSEHKTFLYKCKDKLSV